MASSALHQAVRSRPRNYFYKEKVALKIFGLSLMKNNSLAYKIYSVLFLFCINYSYPILELGDVFKHDFDVIADILIYEFAVFVGMAKTTVMLLNRAKFTKLLNKLEEKPLAPNLERGGEIEEKLVRDCLWITKAQTLTYWIISGVSLTFSVLYTLVIRIRNTDYNKWQFTYGPLTVLNVTYSPNYEISWMYQNIGMLSIGCHFTTIDLMTASILAHISCQFRILQNYIRQIARKSYEAMMKDPQYEILSQTEKCTDKVDPSVVPWRYLRATLEDIVRYHLAIINVLKEVEEVFSTLLLLVFLGTLGMNGFLVFKASLLPINDIRLVKSLTEAISMCLQVLTICYWGEQVLFESQQVGRAAYETNFLGSDLRLQKGLALIIRRSQYPAKLTAGKFSDICLSTFTWTLRASYSAFMLLRKSNEH